MRRLPLIAERTRGRQRFRGRAWRTSSSFSSSSSSSSAFRWKGVAGDEDEDEEKEEESLPRAHPKSPLRLPLSCDSPRGNFHHSHGSFAHFALDRSLPRLHLRVHGALRIRAR